jgi:hypothetical protein
MHEAGRSVLEPKPVLASRVRGGNLQKEGCRGPAGAKCSKSSSSHWLFLPSSGMCWRGVSDRTRQIGRISTGLLMLLGGAAVNAISLAVGVDYADFADDAKFGWVTDAWRAVVPGLTLYALAMLAGPVLLLRAERGAAGEQARSQPRYPVQVG